MPDVDLDKDLDKVIDDPSKRKEPEKKAGEKLLLGKFKSEEEAVTSLKNLERRLTELAEDNKILQSELDRRELEVAGSRAGARGREDQDVDEFALSPEEEDQLRTAPGKVLATRDKRLYSRILNDIRGVMSATQQVSRVEATLRKQFYEDNPDLVGMELLVGAVGQQVQQENPGVPAHRLMGKVSERAKEFVARVKDGKPRSPSGTHIDDDTSRGGRPPKQTESQKELDATYKAQLGGALG